MATPSMTLKHEGRLTAAPTRKGQGSVDSRAAVLAGGSR